MLHIAILDALYCPKRYSLGTIEFNGIIGLCFHVVGQAIHTADVPLLLDCGCVGEPPI